MRALEACGVGRHDYYLPTRYCVFFFVFCHMTRLFVWLVAPNAQEDVRLLTNSAFPKKRDCGYGTHGRC